MRWNGNENRYIAIVGIFEIVFSLPLAFMVYRLWFGFKFFGFLNALCLFVVMAIGADDIFVFMDGGVFSTFLYKPV